MHFSSHKNKRTIFFNRFRITRLMFDKSRLNSGNAENSIFAFFKCRLRLTDSRKSQEKFLTRRQEMIIDFIFIKNAFDNHSLINVTILFYLDKSCTQKVQNGSVNLIRDTTLYTYKIFGHKLLTFAIL